MRISYERRVPSYWKFPVVTLLSCCGLVGAAAMVADPARSQDRPRWDFQPRRLLPPQPAIEQPPTIRAQQVQDQVGDSELVIGMEIGGEASAEGTMTDRQTGTVWDRSSGEALRGPLRKQSLQPEVGSLAFAHSWMSFYPDSRSLSP